MEGNNKREIEKEFFADLVIFNLAFILAFPLMPDTDMVIGMAIGFILIDISLMFDSVYGFFIRGRA